MSRTEPEWDQESRDYATVLGLVQSSQCSGCGQDIDESTSAEANPDYLQLVLQTRAKGGDEAIKDMAQPVVYKAHSHVCFACQAQAKEQEKLKDTDLSGRKVWVTRES